MAEEIKMDAEKQLKGRGLLGKEKHLKRRLQGSKRKSLRDGFLRLNLVGLLGLGR